MTVTNSLTIPETTHIIQLTLAANWKSNMHENCLKVQKALAALEITTEVYELPDSTRSAEEAAAAIGCAVSEIAKSLIFVSDERPVLALVAGHNRVDLSKLAALVGAQVRQPKGSEVKNLTGFPIGGIPPIGHDIDMMVVVDEDLLQHKKIWAAAGTPRSVFSCEPNNFIEKIQAKIAAIKE